MEVDGLLEFCLVEVAGIKDEANPIPAFTEFFQTDFQFVCEVSLGMCCLRFFSYCPRSGA